MCWLLPYGSMHANYLLPTGIWQPQLGPAEPQIPNHASCTYCLSRCAETRIVEQERRAQCHFRYQHSF